MKKSLMLSAVFIAVVGMIAVSCGGSSEDCKTCTSYKVYAEGTSIGQEAPGTRFTKKFCGTALVRQELLDGASAGTVVPTASAVDGTKSVGELKVNWSVECQ